MQVLQLSRSNWNFEDRVINQLVSTWRKKHSEQGWDPTTLTQPTWLLASIKPIYIILVGGKRLIPHCAIPAPLKFGVYILQCRHDLGMTVLTQCVVNLYCSDCGAKDSEGKRPLHFAAHGKGNFARHVVDVLIEKGASEIGKCLNPCSPSYLFISF